MKSFKWQKMMGLGLSAFLLFFGSVGLTGCDVEVEQEGEAEELGEELGEDLDEAVEDVEEEVE